MSEVIKKPSGCNGDRRVLIVTYDWPPSGAVGATRLVKLTKYLINDGWKPTILTVKPALYERAQKAACNDLGVAVIRTAAIPGIAGAYGRVKGRVSGFISGTDRPSGDLLSTEQLSQRKPKHLHNRFARLLLSLLLTPDEFQGWLPFAVARALSVIKGSGIGCVVTSAPPFTSHLIGLIIKLSVPSVRWVADFRDPWTENRQRAVTTRMSETINSWLEGKVVRRADRIVMVTAAMAAWYRNRYQDVKSNRWVTITNGFDRLDYTISKRATDKFTISYIGSIEYDRSPESVFIAIAQLCQECLVEKGCVRIVLIGKCRQMAGKRTEEVLKDLSLADVAEISDLLPREVALQQMVTSDVLLLLAARQELQVPAKAYEYIASGPFILALTEEKSATADLMRQVGNAAVVDEDDIDAIKAILLERYTEWQLRRGQGGAVKHQRDNVCLEEYEWSSLGHRYSSLLRDLQHS